MREAKEAGEPVGWSSSKFPCELAESFGLHVGYPENQAAGIAANRDGEVMCQAAEDLGYDNDICGYSRISLAYAAGYRGANKMDKDGNYVINPNSGKPLKDANGNKVLDENGKPVKDPKTLNRMQRRIISMKLQPFRTEKKRPAVRTRFINIVR